MPFEFATDKEDVRAIDAGVKNKWRWDWLDDEFLKQYVRKIKSPGQAFCVLCNQSLAGMKTVSRTTSADQQTNVVQPVVPLNDRKLNAEAMILGFLAEHDLPFTLTPHLVKLTQTLAKDPKPLNEIKMERCAASYKMTYGVAEHFTQEFMDELKDTEFSLNIDESTNTKNEKIVAVLISYFSKHRQEIVVRHLESFQVIKADAESIFLKIEEMFDRFDLPWTNLISVLLDSCNTMRGKKSGLEARLRERAPQLLDIDGDSVHHVHNAAKAFTSPFGYHLESLFNDIHSDFNWSIDLRSELELICQLIGVKFTVPERFTSHRFLSAHNLAVETSRLLNRILSSITSSCQRMKEKDLSQ